MFFSDFILTINVQIQKTLKNITLGQIIIQEN